MMILQIFVATLFLQVHIGQSIVENLKGIYSNYDGVEYVYQVPSNKESIKGVVFLAHGCAHASTDWWPKSDACPSCIGLPVESSITNYALEHNYVPVAISAENQAHRCWTEYDAPRVMKVIQQIYQSVLQDNQYSIPFFTLGVSSGGGFVGILGQKADLTPRPKAIVVQISAIRLISSHPNLRVLFLPMVKDPFTMHRINRSLPRLKQAKVLKVEPKPITKEYFYQHSLGTINEKDSESLYLALKEGQYLDSSTNLLLADPRESDWRSAIQEKLPHILNQDRLVADRSPIAELLNMAYAMHEITDEHLKEAFEFFEENRSPPVAQ